MRRFAGGFDLTGTTAVVTGAASGIGEATAKVLADAGASVVAADVNGEGAARTVADIVAAGGRAASIEVDVRERASLDAAVDLAVSTYGSLDAMCNVAGVPNDGPVHEADEAEYVRVFDINVKGVLFGCQAAARVMKPQGRGVIVNVSSTGIDVPVPSGGLYAMSKAAVAMMTMSLATELGPFGIRVNATAPGATLTPFSARHLYDEAGNRDERRFDEFVERMRGFSPLGIVGDALDQAYLILYLVSPAAKYATGNIFRVNGGQSMVW
jgi:3-oxoacyl-[acyl-carrier protein] reductase